MVGTAACAGETENGAQMTERLIDRVRREADEGRERIAERQRQRQDLEERASHGDLDAVIAYDDILRAERAEPLGAAYVQRRVDAGGLLRRTMENAMVGPAQPEPTDWSAWEAWMKAHLDNARAELHEEVAQAIGICMAETREEMRAEFKTAIVERDARISRLEGQIEMLTRLYAPSADVTELPKGFLRKVHHG